MNEQDDGRKPLRVAGNSIHFNWMTGSVGPTLPVESPARHLQRVPYDTEEQLVHNTFYSQSSLPATTYSDGEGRPPTQMTRYRRTQSATAHETPPSPQVSVQVEQMAQLQLPRFERVPHYDTENLRAVDIEMGNEPNLLRNTVVEYVNAEKAAATPANGMQLCQIECII